MAVLTTKDKIKVRKFVWTLVREADLGDYLGNIFKNEKNEDVFNNKINAAVGYIKKLLG